MSAIWRGRAAGPFYALAFTALAIACLSWSRDHLVPIALGILVWFLVNAFTDAIGRLPYLGPRMPRLLRRVSAVVILTAAMLFSARLLALNIAELGQAVEARDHTALARIRGLVEPYGLADKFTYHAISERLELEKIAGPILGMVQSLASDAGLVLIYALFLMVDEKHYAAKLRALQPDPVKRRVLRQSLRDISDQTRWYLWLMTLLSLAVGVATWAVCAWFGVAAAGFWGFLAFALNYIPTIGSFAGVLLPTGYALATLVDPSSVLAILLILGVVQFIAGDVAAPRLMGEGLNLSTTVIMLSLVVWGAMWGVAGMFLAVPLMVILTMVLARFPSTRPLAIILSMDGTAGPDMRPPRGLGGRRDLEEEDDDGPLPGDEREVELLEPARPPASPEVEALARQREIIEARRLGGGLGGGPGGGLL